MEKESEDQKKKVYVSGVEENKKAFENLYQKKDYTFIPLNQILN